MELTAQGYKKGSNAVSTNRKVSPLLVKGVLGDHVRVKRTEPVYFKLGRHIVNSYVWVVLFCLLLSAFSILNSSAVRRCCLFPTAGAFHRHPITLKEIRDLA